MRPTVKGILLIAAGIVPAVLPVLVSGRLWPFWTTYVCAAVFLIALDLILAAPARHIALEVEAPDTLHVGETRDLVIRLRLTRGIPTRFAASVGLSESLRPAATLGGALSVGGVEVRVPLVPIRRGRAEIEKVWLRRTGPLGLAERIATFPLHRVVTVVPDVLPTRQAALRLLRDPSYRAGLKIEKYKGDGTEFDSLRVFVEGDDRRSIHWRASARHRTLLCRQYRAERNHQIVLAVDTGHLMSEPLAGGIPKVDHAVTAALLLAYVGLHSGDRVGCFSFDAGVGGFLEPRAGVAQYRRITGFTSGIDYSTAETNFTLGLTALSEKLKRRSLVVVLTDFVDTVTAELMVENLARLARTHLVVFVSLSDPRIRRLASTPPSDILDLNRAVVAGSYRKERDVVLKRLQRLGLFTIDADPPEVRSSLINRYLEIKRRELV